MSTTIYQSPEEISKICTYWIQTVVPVRFPGFVDDKYNSDLIHGYIQSNHGGFYSLANLTKVAESLKSTLRGVGVAESAEVKAARAKEAAEKAEADRLQKVAAERDRILQIWLRDHCPVGLKTSNGEPYAGDVDRILEFLNRNYNGEITIESLNDAILTQSNVLTWFSRKPEDTQIRGIKPKERILSDKMKRESGMLPRESENPSHSKTDGHFKSPKELIQFMAQEELKRRGITEDPEMIAADQISVTNRYCKLDHAFNSNLKKIFARNADGSVNTKKTKEARLAAATEYERRRNRDNGQRG